MTPYPILRHPAIEAEYWRSATGAVGLRVWWRADRRRTLTLDPLHAPGAATGRPRRTLVAQRQARLARWLAADPGRGVHVSRVDGILRISLEDRWTPARVRAANVALAALGAPLRLQYVPRSTQFNGKPSDVRMVREGSSVVEWWGDARERRILC